jgi:hypothetical protein
MRTRRDLHIRRVLLLFALSLAASCRSVHPLFDLGAPATAPFPSDRWTVEDEGQLTGLRVNLPKPDCVARPSDCEDIDVLNELDGFNPEPRVSIRFAGAIDPNTAKDGVFILALDGSRRVVGINRVVWDVLTNTLHATSDQFLDQHARYALIVTRVVRDADGDPIETSDSFNTFRHDLKFGQSDDPDLNRYRKELIDAEDAAEEAGIARGDIAVMSVFTTRSVTVTLEKIRDQIKAATPAPANFDIGIAPAGARAVFDLSTVDDATSTIRRQTRTEPPVGAPAPIGAFLLGTTPLSPFAPPGAAGVVARIAFGQYASPDYMRCESIPVFPTRSGAPAVQRINNVGFVLILPSGSKPAAGWPVAIISHGRTVEFLNAFHCAATLAAHGIASIAINAPGHGGGGTLGTITIGRKDGTSVKVPAFGRGIDQDGDGVIAADEGVFAAPPRAILRIANGIQQTVVDQMQLVRVIEVGMDPDGDGERDLDPSRIYVAGVSFGGNTTVLLLAIEPKVRAGVANVPGAGVMFEPLSLGAVRGKLGAALASRNPSLINDTVEHPGVRMIGGVAVKGPFFTDSMALRDTAPVFNETPGAMEIQEVIENQKWASLAGIPDAYTTYIRKQPLPLPGVAAKPVILQIAMGDVGTHIPSSTSMVRAGDLADRAFFYQHQLLYAENPQIPKDPHALTFFYLPFPPFNLGAMGPAALGCQRQFAVFFASDGRITDDLSDVATRGGRPLFKVGPPLPEGLNYIP